MIITIEINIPEEIYREAIAEGWNKRFGETIDAQDVTMLDDVTDFVWAVPHISLGEDNTTITVQS